MNQNYYIGNSLFVFVQCVWSIIVLHLTFKATQLLAFEGSTSYLPPTQQSCHIQLLAIWKQTFICFKCWNHLLSLFSQDDMGPKQHEKKFMKIYERKSLHFKLFNLSLVGV